MVLDHVIVFSPDLIFHDLVIDLRPAAFFMLLFVLKGNVLLFIFVMMQHI